MENYFAQLNEAQKKAVADTEGAVLVIAGAGSGKTRVLTARVCRLIDNGVSPYCILAITFTNKAANEMKARITSALGELGEGVWTSTFHSMCAKMLRFDADKLGYDKNYSIYTDLESDRVVKRVCASVSGADVKQKGDYLQHISRAKTLGLSPAQYYEEIKNDVADAKVITGVYKAYEAELKSSNALDFDDLLLKTVELFEKFPEVLDKYRRRFKYINVDEFQDTNAMQYKLVKLLASGYGNLFVVGDEDQSIYSWRGAEIKNILDFGKDFPTAKTYKLEQNYRSTASILKAANNVIKHNRARNEKTLWSENSRDDSVEYCEAYNDREEAQFVTRKISDSVYFGGAYRDCAVLVRANSLTRLFEEDFNLHGIPYKVFGGFRFFERKEIKDTLAYVRLALNPNDNDSLLRIVNYPKRGIGSSAVAELADAAARRGVPMFYILGQADALSSSTAKKLAGFTAIVSDLITASATRQPAEFMEYTIQRSGLQNALTQSGDAEDINRYENIEELLNAVVQFSKDNPASDISDFMQSVSLVSDTDEMDSDDYVTIATIHAVKGLEFDKVFTVGLEDGIFPTMRSINSGDVEEERRLMYVAITRARTKFYASWARSRYRFGETVFLPKSRFIAEMRGESGSVRLSDKSDSFTDAVKFSYNSKFGGAQGFAGSAKGFGSYGAQASGGYKQSATQMQASKPFGSRAGGNSVNFANVDYDKYQKNTVVEHNKFGRGIITETSGSGEDKTAMILFRGIGVKRFSLAVAAPNLRIVETDGE